LQAEKKVSGLQQNQARHQTEPMRAGRLRCPEKLHGSVFLAACLAAQRHLKLFQLCDAEES
jgi:hypothetical protein